MGLVSSMLALSFYWNSIAAQTMQNTIIYHISYQVVCTGKNNSVKCLNCLAVPVDRDHCILDRSKRRGQSKCNIRCDNF